MPDQRWNNILAKWAATGTFTRSGVTDNGVDPDQPNLIHFTDAAGVERYPAFQFDPNGQPYEVVLKVNEVFDYEDAKARAGITDWWFSTQLNGAERFIPKDMIREDAIWVTYPDLGTEFARGVVAGWREDCE